MTDTAVPITDTLDFSKEAVRIKQLQDSENSNAAINIASIIAGVASGSFPVVSAGASGTAGDVDIYPATASKGKTRLSASNNTGNTTTTINTAAQAGARTYTIPDAGASTANFILDTGGVFATMFRIPRATLAAAGTGVVGDAAQLVAGFTSVTGADGTKATKLPATPAAGTIVIVKNTVSNHVLPVFPDAAATINAIGSNGAISLAASVAAIFIADSATQWYTLPFLPS